MIIDLAACTEPINGGHLIWDGPVRTDGSPCIYLTKKIHRSAIVVIFTSDRGREPVGYIKSTCRVPLCVAPEHFNDDAERQAAYREIAEQTGKATTEGYCQQGHAWADYVRFSPDGRRSCEGCRLGVPPVSHEISIALTLDGVREELPRRDEMETVRRAICVRGATHKQAAELIGRSPRTVSRWAARHDWRKPVRC